LARQKRLLIGFQGRDALESLMEYQGPKEVGQIIGLAIEASPPIDIAIDTVQVCQAPELARLRKHVSKARYPFSNDVLASTADFAKHRLC